MAKDVWPRYPRSKDHMPDGDPVGRDTMAALTGRTRSAVIKWINRGVLPPLDGPWIEGGPSLRRRTFLAWAFQRGFLEHPQTGERMPDWEEGRRWTITVSPEQLTSVAELRARGVRLEDYPVGPDA